jgi:hypothetical protein
MGRRGAVILLVVAALLALPALCLGGVLEHACGRAQGDCGHHTCAADPCDALARGDEPDWDAFDALTAAPRHSGVAVYLVPTPPVWVRRIREARPPPRSLPYHDSDLPLRL